MKQSESINELAQALAIAQGEIENAIADAENPHFRSNYADLASIRAAIKTPLSKNGLAVAQLPTTQDGKAALTTRLMHKSGQWIEDTFVLMVEKPTMQGLGSAITYARRYGLSSLTGLAEKDDDGNAAEKHPVQTPQKQPQAQAPAKTALPNGGASTFGDGATEKQRKLVETRLDIRLGVKPIDAGPLLMAAVGKPSIEMLTKGDVNPLLAWIDAEAVSRSETNEEVPRY